MDAHNVLKQKKKAPFVGASDPGASGIIEWDRDEQVIELKPASGAAETRTLIGPTRSGLKLRLDCTEFTASSTCTVTVYDSGNNATSTIVFSATKQFAKLESFWNATLTTYEWRVQVSSGVALTTATADTKFRELRTKTTATSGTSRNLYLRHEFSGAGGDGECLRAFSVLSAAVTTARGGQVSLNVGATGYVSGLGSGLEGQLYVQGIVPANGTYYGMKAEMYFDADATIAAATEHAILAIQANGDATAAATCLNAISFVGGADSGGGQMVSPGTSMGTVTGTIRVLVNGAVRYLPFYSHEGHA